MGNTMVFLFGAAAMLTRLSLLPSGAVTALEHVSLTIGMESGLPLQGQAVRARQLY